MKYIKTYESYDVSIQEFLGSYLKDVETLIQFDGKSKTIKQIEEFVTIDDFIYEYQESTKKTWMGGPVDRDWVKKWGPFFGVSGAKAFAPILCCKMIFEDDSIIAIGFSLLTKKIIYFNFGHSENGTYGYEFNLRFNHLFGKVPKFTNYKTYQDFDKFKVLFSSVVGYDFDYKV